MSENLSAYANYELGEAFFEIINKMVVRDGIPFPRIGDFEIVSPNWRKLADKKDKTPDEIKKIDDDYKMEIRDLADSCMVYMGAKTNNKTYRTNLSSNCGSCIWRKDRRCNITIFKYISNAGIVFNYNNSYLDCRSNKCN